ncbi:unnamed protein product [Discula destructiva]
MLSRAALRLAQAQPAAISRWASSPSSRRAAPALLAVPTIWSRGLASAGKPPPPPSSFRFAAPSSSSPGPSSNSSRQQQPVTPPPPSASTPSEPTKAPEPLKSKPIEPAADSTPDIPDKQIPLSELPDLTQGIPSTLEYETAGTTQRAALEAVEEDAKAGGAGGGRGKGELPASAYISSTERKRQRFANIMFALTLGGMATGVVYLGRNWDEEDLRRHPDVPNGWGLGLWWNRASTRMKEVMTYYHEPAFEKLLPDPDPMFERPYTLVISLEDMLVHSEWTREHGWRLAKRPGADYFLHYLSQYYELVLFTTVPFAIAEPLVRKLDPYRFIVWPLFREATKYKDGEIIKDLSYLNRDLSKVIVVDSNASHVRNQPENAIVLPPWKGDPKDKELVGLIPFLEYIHTMQYSDVRKVLKSFEGKHIPTEFARREGIARAEFNKQLEAERRKHPNKGRSGMAALGGLIGLKPQNLSLLVVPDGEINPADAFAQGKMLQDIARERGQRNYEEIEKMIRENGEKWLKEEAALQEQAQKEAMNSMKSSFTSWFVPSSAEEAKDGSAEKKA